MAGAACTAVRAAEVGSALQRERGRAVVGAADAMRVPLRRAAAPNAQSQCAGALCRVLGVVPSGVLVPYAYMRVLWPRRVVYGRLNQSVLLYEVRSYSSFVQYTVRYSTVVGNTVSAWMTESGCMRMRSGSF